MSSSWQMQSQGKGGGEEPKAAASQLRVGRKAWGWAIWARREVSRRERSRAERMGRRRVSLISGDDQKKKEKKKRRELYQGSN